MQEYIKQREEEFENRYRGSVTDKYPEYAESHNILLNDIKDFIKQTIIGLLEKECERLNKLDKDRNNDTLTGGLENIHRAGFNGGYNQALQDQINYYQKQIKTLKELSNLKK